MTLDKQVSIHNKLCMYNFNHRGGRKTKALEADISNPKSI